MMKTASALRRGSSASAQDAPTTLREDLNSVITILKKGALSNPL